MAARTAVWLAGLGCALQVKAETQVDGSGTTNPSKFFWQIMETMQARAKEEIRLTYRAVGSSNGQREFSSASEDAADSGNYSSSVNDFGAGDIPMSTTRFDGMAASGREMLHVPFCLGAIGVFHNVPAAEVGNDGLKLSPCVLAKIFAGAITTWDHDDIATDNPNLQVPTNQLIKVCHRSDGSSSTTGFTGYLNSKCSSDWSLGSGSTVTWVTSSGFQANEGSPGVTACIYDNSYSIGYLDAGHGHNRNFLEAMLKNEANTWLTSAQAIAYQDSNGENGVAAAAAALTSPPAADASWAAVNLYAQAGDMTWPIVLISYIYLKKDMSSMDGQKVQLLEAFVDMVMDKDEGQALLPDYSFNAVPTSWANTWTATTKGMITRPATPGTKYQTEGDTTEKWEGMGNDYISKKRSSYSLWKLNEIDIAMTAMEARVAALETTLSDYGIVALHGSGTTNPKNWFAKAMKLLETRARAPLHLTYRAVGSSTGQAEFVGDANNNYQSYNHFGAGDIPMSSSNYALLTAGKEMVHLPFALGAIGIFHNVPASVRGSTDIILTACLLAKIFNGDITTWDDPDIKALNSNLNPPASQKIMVGHRTLGSSSTGGVTGYLAKSCLASWPRGSGSSITWPSTASGHDNFVAVEGSQGMQAHIDGTEYSIGYLDAGHGHDLNFAEIALKNANGISRTSKESLALSPNGVAEAGNQGVLGSTFPSDASADWSLVNLLDMPGQNTWPIVLVTYLYVKKDQLATNTKTAAALKAFIDFILGNKDGLLEEFSFTAPDSSLNTLATTGAGTIMWPAGMEAFTFEESTDKYNGMGVNVISVKRTSYDLYQSGVLEDSLTELAGVAGSNPSSVAAASADSDSDPLPLVLSVLALVISLFSGIPGCLALKRPAGGGSAARSDLPFVDPAPGVVGSPSNANPEHSE
jgi:ABC-type phosphate transport system substrate-binding protein